jgi:hypothetical protein
MLIVFVACGKNDFSATPKSCSPNKPTDCPGAEEYCMFNQKLSRYNCCQRVDPTVLQEEQQQAGDQSPESMSSPFGNHKFIDLPHCLLAADAFDNHARAQPAVVGSSRQPSWWSRLFGAASG